MGKERKYRNIRLIFTRIKTFMAFEFESISLHEKLVASFGGALGITLISVVSYNMIGAEGAVLIVPSMGAAAVLVFAVPHGKLSQPWPLLGGNLVSALVGVSCYSLVPDPSLAAGLAVGLAIAFMHLLYCVHPPGGATALAAVIGGEQIHELGYTYVLSPVLLNVTIIFLVAVIFNGFFAWRRYPAAAMMRFTENRPSHEHTPGLVDKQVIEKAVADMDLVLDVTTEDLQRVIKLSLDHAKSRQLVAEQILLGHYYSNGAHGPEWTVRRIIDESYSDDPKKDMVIYRVVEGQRFNTADSCTRQAFARWAAREVFPNNSTSAED